MPAFHKGPLSVEIVYMSAHDKIAAEWPTVVDDKGAAGKTDGPPDVVIVAMLPGSVAAAIKVVQVGPPGRPIEGDSGAFSDP